jgi:ACS family allantoate permease-like MFS transporter
MAPATEATHQQEDVEKVVSAADNESVSPGIVQKLDEKILKHSHDADAAMKAFEGMDGQVIELTPEKNKALLRKIDWHLMPVSGPLPNPFTFLNSNTCRSCA